MVNCKIKHVDSEGGPRGRVRILSSNENELNCFNQDYDCSAWQLISAHSDRTAKRCWYRTCSNTYIEPEQKKIKIRHIIIGCVGGFDELVSHVVKFKSYIYHKHKISISILGSTTLLPLLFPGASDSGKLIFYT